MVLVPANPDPPCTKALTNRKGYPRHCGFRGVLLFMPCAKSRHQHPIPVNKERRVGMDSSGDARPSPKVTLLDSLDPNTIEEGYTSHWLHHLDGYKLAQLAGLSVSLLFQSPQISVGEGTGSGWSPLADRIR